MGTHVLKLPLYLLPIRVIYEIVGQKKAKFGLWATTRTTESSGQIE
jgi:hypothetical protein